MILNYPVITAKKPYLHEGSFLNLLGENSGIRREELSIERQVTPDMPPCFIWHTFTDQSVPVENALFPASALRQAGVSTELHIYPEGDHGLSLGDEITAYADGSKVCKPVQSWINLLQVWFECRTREPAEDICKIKENHVQ